MKRRRRATSRPKTGLAGEPVSAIAESEMLPSDAPNTTSLLPLPAKKKSTVLPPNSGSKAPERGGADIEDRALPQTMPVIERSGADPESERLASGHFLAKSCKYCRSTIAEGATFCPNCRQDQSSIKNRLVFLSTIAGALALVFSAATYVTKELINIYDEKFSKEKLTLNDFYAPFSDQFAGVLTNPTSQPLFVTDLIIRWPTGSTTVLIQKIVQPKSAVKIEQIQKSPVSWTALPLASASSLDPAKVYPSARHIQLSSLSGVTAASTNIPCIWIEFQTPDTGDLENTSTFMSASGQPLMIGQADGVLNFISVRNGGLMKEHIPLAVTFNVQRLTDDCRKFSLQDVE